MSHLAGWLATLVEDIALCDAVLCRAFESLFGVHVFLQALPKRVRLARNTESVRNRQLAKTDHMRTRIIGVPRATHGAHLHVDTDTRSRAPKSPTHRAMLTVERVVCSFISARTS